MAATQVLRNTAALVDVIFYADESPVDADGAVTLSISRADGSVLVAGAATQPGGPVGNYRYTLAPRPDLDRLGLTWTGTFSGVAQAVETDVEIVGGTYLAVSEIRREQNLQDPTKFPTRSLETQRRWFEQLAERFCGVAFVPRFERDLLDGAGVATTLLSRSRLRRLLYAVVDGTAVSSEDLAAWTTYGSGQVVRSTPFPPGAANLSVAYEHGWDAPPEDVRQAALVAIRDRLMTENAGNRHYGLATDGGVVRVSMPGPDRPTGIPFCDEVLTGYRSRPIVAGSYRAAADRYGVAI